MPRYRGGMSGSANGETAATATAVGGVPAGRVARGAGGPGEGGPGGGGSGGEDLTWLLHRGAQRLRTALDEVAHELGLSGARDWIVLTALVAGPARTQLALGHELGLDKTTMTLLLDRLTSAGLVV